MSDSAAATAREIMALREDLRALGLPPQAARLVEQLYEHPVLTARRAESLLGVAFATANRALDDLETAGVIREVTGQQRNRRFRFDLYLNLFDRAPLGPGGEGADVRTRAGTKG